LIKMARNQRKNYTYKSTTEKAKAKHSN